MREGLQSSLTAALLLGLHTLGGGGGVDRAGARGGTWVGRKHREDSRSCCHPFPPLASSRNMCRGGGGVGERTKHVSNVLVLYYCFHPCGDKSM